VTCHTARIISFAATVMTPTSDTRAVRAVPPWLITTALIVASVTRRIGATGNSCSLSTVTRQLTRVVKPALPITPVCQVRHCNCAIDANRPNPSSLTMFFI